MEQFNQTEEVLLWPSGELRRRTVPFENRNQAGERVFVEYKCAICGAWNTYKTNSSYGGMNICTDCYGDAWPLREELWNEWKGTNPS